MTRQQIILESLIKLDRPMAELLKDVSDLPWDNDSEVVELRKEDVVEMLSRFLRQEVTQEEVEAWADAIESREDIGREDRNKDQINGVLFRLSNPEINGILTKELAEELLAKL